MSTVYESLVRRKNENDKGDGHRRGEDWIGLGWRRLCDGRDTFERTGGKWGRVVRSY